MKRLLNRNENLISQSNVVNKLLKCLNGTIAAIEHENKCLSKGNLSEIKKIIEQKVEYLEEFDDIQRQLDILVYSNNFDRNDQSLIKLKPLFEKLDRLNQENEILLQTNIEVNTQVVEIYKMTKKEMTLKKFGYNKHGNFVAAKNLEKLMPATSLNDKV